MTEPEPVLIEDLRQHNTNLQNQYTRMHSRLQLIVGLNTTLIAALGALAAASGRGDVDQRWLLLFPIAGLLLSSVGYVAGSGDRWLVELYRRQLHAAAKRLVPGRPEDAATTLAEWAHAGMDPNEASKIIGRTADSAPTEAADPNQQMGGRPPNWLDRVTAWLDHRVTSRRWSSLSVTRLPAAMSLLFIFAWLVVLVLLGVVAVD